MLDRVRMRMGFWDSVRSFFRSTPALPARPWHFVDDSEWAERLGAHDLAQAQVYGDWLEERGDTRAELIRQAAEPQFSDFVRTHATALFAEWGVHLVKPPEYGRPALEPSWRHGVLHGLSVRTEQPWVDAVGLVALPIAAHLRDFAVGVRPDSLGADDEALGALEVIGRRLPRLTSLFAGDFLYPSECEMSWAHVGNLSAAWKHFPALTTFKARGVVEALGDIDAPHLTHFVRETGSLTKGELESITRARWPKLTHLEVWFGDANYGADCTVEDVRPLLASTPPPALISLGLKNFEFVDGLISPLLESAWLKQVKHLDLSMGVLTDEGADELLRSRSRLAHLESLDLSRNLLSERHLPELKAICRQVVVEGQRLGEMDEDMRYVAVSE